jgi:UDP-glucose 4-epimerase|tara:strand:+ start:460 stop:1350 length:891 start_codon:yes stop_codon:yes gene_type:complete
MKIMVTGGVGFVGTNLIKQLLLDGNEVISLDNYSTGKKENEVDHKNVTYVDVDISDNLKRHKAFGLVKYGLEKPDIIYHMAALARIQPSIENPTDTINNNFNSTLNILDWAKQNNIPVVFAGSSSKHHGLWGSPYAWSKFGGEQLCELYNKVYNLPTAVCRFYNVYGPTQIEDGAYATVIGIFEKQFREGKALTVVGSGEQRRDFTHIEDIVDGIIKCGENIEKVSGEIFELGRGKNYSIIEITKMFGETEVEYIAARPGEYDVTLADYSKAKKLLNWKPSKDIKNYIKNIINDKS